MTQEEVLKKRIEELEEIVKEKNHLIYDMYNSDLEISWSKKSDELQRKYEEKYKENLEYKEDL